MTDYMKKVAMKDKAIDHRLFLASRAEWIRQHNEEPVKTKLSNKTDLKKVQESLLTTQRTGGRFEKPETEFVCEEDWDSDDGEYDKSKVVEAEVFGALKRGNLEGHWKKRNLPTSYFEISLFSSKAHLQFLALLLGSQRRSELNSLELMRL